MHQKKLYSLFHHLTLQGDEDAALRIGQPHPGLAVLDYSVRAEHCPLLIYIHKVLERNGEELVKMQQVQGRDSFLCYKTRHKRERTRGSTSCTLNPMRKSILLAEIRVKKDNIFMVQCLPDYPQEDFKDKLNNLSEELQSSRPLPEGSSIPPKGTSNPMLRRQKKFPKLLPSSTTTGNMGQKLPCFYTYRGPRTEGERIEAVLSPSLTSTIIITSEHISPV